MSQYEILEEIGQDGGRVRKARQILLDRLVVIKSLSADVIFDDESLKRFQREAKIASSMDHPNIGKIYSFEAGAEEGPFLVMEYLAGTTLSAILKEQGRLSLDDFKTVFLQLACALDYAHSKGVIHRDIKPGNIMLLKTDAQQVNRDLVALGEQPAASSHQSVSDEQVASGIQAMTSNSVKNDQADEKSHEQNGNTGEISSALVKLLDFGIAKRVDDPSGTIALTRTGFALGTPEYMSPEQCSGASCDARSDIYSLACVMYEALCGKPPFTGASAGVVMLSQVNEAPPPLEQANSGLKLPPSLLTLIYRCLNKSPQARPQSAAELAELLVKACSEPAKEVSSRTGKTPAVRLFLIGGSVLMVAALSIIMISAIHQQSAMQAGERKKAIFQSWKDIEQLVHAGNDSQQNSQYLKAKASYDSALRLAQPLLKSASAAKHCKTLFALYHGLAKCNLAQADWQKYSEFAHESIVCARKAFGAESEELEYAERDLAANLCIIGTRLEEAEAAAKDVQTICLHHAQELNKRIKNDQLAMIEYSDEISHADCRFGSATSLVGYVDFKQGRFEKARKELTQALGIERQNCGEADENTLWTSARLCWCLDKSNLQKQEDLLLADLLESLVAANATERIKLLSQLERYYKDTAQPRRRELVAKARKRFSDLK